MFIKKKDQNMPKIIADEIPNVKVCLDQCRCTDRIIGNKITHSKKFPITTMTSIFEKEYQFNSRSVRTARYVLRKQSFILKNQLITPDHPNYSKLFNMMIKSKTILYDNNENYCSLVMSSDLPKEILTVLEIKKNANAVVVLYSNALFFEDRRFYANGWFWTHQLKQYKINLNYLDSIQNATRTIALPEHKTLDNGMKTIRRMMRNNPLVESMKYTKYKLDISLRGSTYNFTNRILNSRQLPDIKYEPGIVEFSIKLFPKYHIEIKSGVHPHAFVRNGESHICFGSYGGEINNLLFNGNFIGFFILFLDWFSNINYGDTYNIHKFGYQCPQCKRIMIKSSYERASLSTEEICNKCKKRNEKNEIK